jgi:hypothetical protein
MPFERDYFKRQIKALVDGLARALGLARKEHRHDDALEAIRKTPSDWFGIEAEVLERVDPASAVMLLREPAKVEAYVWLLEQQAEIHDERGDAPAATASRARAAAIRAAAAAATPG